MGQRDSRNHHANRRRKIEKENSSRAQKNAELEERVPLAGYEELYEISRSGRVFSRTTRAVLVGGYHYSPFIRITVNGAVVTLSKEKALAESWAAKQKAQP
ncbi:MAG: NUMOD4 domain-containing protein [Gemmatimonadota bacterium]